jgi:hypothetical protein
MLSVLVAAAWTGSAGAQSSSTSGGFGVHAGHDANAARPNDPPIGVPLQTLTTNPDGGVLLDAKPVPYTYDRNGIFVVAINRATRAIVESGTTPRYPVGLTQLTDISKQYSGTDGYIMIVSSSKGVDPSAIGQLNGLARGLGAPDFSAQDLSKISSGLPFSIVGIPGGAANSAWTNVAQKANDGLNGNITGYLQYNTKDNLYGYVNTDLLTFNTQASSGPMSNTISFAGKNYPVSLAGAFNAGFDVMGVDGLTGQVLSEGYGSGTNGSGYDTQYQQAFAEVIKQTIDLNVPRSSGRPVLVFIQSISHPAGVAPGWSNAANLIASLGGNPLDLLKLDGTSGFSFVGSVTSKGAAVEASDVSGQPGPLVGVLARTHDYTYQPVIAGPAGGINTDLISITNQAPQAFPPFTPSQSAAETAIGRELRLCSDSGPCSVRNAYYLSYQDDWGVLLTQLGRLTYPTTAKDYSSPDFDAVKVQLEKEFAAVARVKTYFTALQAPFLGASQGDRLDLKSIGDAVYNSVAPPPGNTATPYLLGLLGKIAALGGILPPPANGIAAGVSASFALGAYLTQPDGAPVLADVVRLRADQLVGAFKSRMDTAAANLVHVALVDVSDYGKLMAVYDHLNQPGWQLPSDPAESITAMTLGVKQWLAQQLVPVAYPWLIRANPSVSAGGPKTANGVTCKAVEAGYFETWNTWINQPANAQYQAVDSWGPAGKVTSLFWFSRTPQITEERSNAPTQALADLLFNPPNPRTGTLGLNPVTFYTPQVFGPVHLANNGGSSCNFWGKGGKPLQ